MSSELPLRSTSDERTIAVIGAGIGGLATAIRLAQAGHQVTVFEKNHGPGGRCGVRKEGGYTWDLGPTILLMPEVIRDVFVSAGRDPADYIDLVPCDPNYRIHFADESSLTFTTNLPQMRDELERVEPGAFEQYLSLLSFGRHAYDTSVGKLVSKPLDSALRYLDPRLLTTVLSVKAHRKLHPWLSRLFRDPRLQRAFSFQTMYLGISPYEAPATFALLPYTELAMGIWYTRGGVHALPRAMERLARELGVTFIYGAPVERILTRDSLATGLQVAGDALDFDAVVANADLPYVEQDLLPDRRVRPGRRYTSSAFMLYLGLDRRYEHLEHHNVVFGEAYKETFQEIFSDRVLPADPAFYVNRPTHSDSSLAPPGCDALYVLVPVPHQTEGIRWSEVVDQLRGDVLSRMERRLGLTNLRSHIRVERWLTPDDWAQRFNLAKGACFGLAHDFWQVGALRPSTRDRQFRNLYYVGASTQPGTGVPLVMLSARIVAERFARELSEIPSNQPARRQRPQLLEVA